MAGFAVVVTILIWGVTGLFGACALSLFLFFLSLRKLRKEHRKDNGLIALSIIAPFFGLVWLIVVLLFHVQISNKMAHQDCGLSGDPYVTLPNGYEVGSHNTYDGYIRAPGARTDVPAAGPGYVRGVISLHFINGQFSGTQFDHDASSIRRFTLDAKTQAFQSSLVGISSWNSANDEAQLGKDSYWKIYAEYRHHWPNYILLLLIVGGEGAIIFWVRRMWFKMPLNKDCLETGNENAG